MLDLDPLLLMIISSICFLGLKGVQQQINEVSQLYSRLYMHISNTNVRNTEEAV